MQWVLGKEIRLPAVLCDDSEVARIGAQALPSEEVNQWTIAANEVDLIDPASVWRNWLH